MPNHHLFCWRMPKDKKVARKFYKEWIKSRICYCLTSFPLWFFPLPARECPDPPNLSYYPPPPPIISAVHTSIQALPSAFWCFCLQTTCCMGAVLQIWLSYWILSKYKMYKNYFILICYLIISQNQGTFEKSQPPKCKCTPSTKIYIPEFSFPNGK